MAIIESASCLLTIFKFTNTGFDTNFLYAQNIGFYLVKIYKLPSMKWQNPTSKQRTNIIL